MIWIRNLICSRLVLGALFVLLLTAGAITYFPFVGVQEIKAPPGDQLQSMLTAINEIRERRDITLDCAKYVYPHLGRSDRVKHYIDLLSENGIKNSSLVKGRGQTYHFGFSIDYSHLRNVPNSKFGRRDIVVIVFIAEGNDQDSPIQTCKAILKAAPDHL
jgi:hypothetical protein